MTDRPVRIGVVAGAAVSVVLLLAATLLRLELDDQGATALPDRLLLVLIAAGFLLGALLALPRSGAVAWTLVALSSGLAAFDIVGVVRAVEPLAGGQSDLTSIAAVTIVAATGVAAASAARSGAIDAAAGRIALAAVGLGLAATVLAAIWAVFGADGTATAGPGTTPLRIAARIALLTWAGALGLAVVRDLWAPATRAARQLRDPTRTGRRVGLWAYFSLFADELLPGRSRDRRQAVEAERARLAAELHAFVLPDLRRAASSAEAAGAPEAMQVDLRRALDDVEQLMHKRQSIVLEQFGLVAALEWLAERTEERSPLRVELEIDGDVPDGRTAIASVVARAAFRIALLGLDNVTRHSRATTAVIRVSTTGGELSLQIVDDGLAADLESASGRGLADMRSEASASGGSIAIQGGTGARIQASWPRGAIAVKPGARPAHLTDRSGTSAH